MFRENNGSFDYLVNYMMNYQPTHNYNTRDKSLRLPEVSLERFRQSFMYQGSKLWNDLPNDVKQFRSLFSFKRQVKKFLNDHYK